jgi:Dolichyl-phosphate-mannose-protein mannosyltransferase
VTALRGRLPPLVAAALILAAIALRIEAAARPGLWADEIFSLAMATGHSLEHPATTADSALGDFVQPSAAHSPETFRRYAEHESRPAGARRVVRAVLLSDTSPPLYYLLLNGWTRWFGTDDTPLRLFSVWWAVLSLPLLWLLGRELGGPRAAWSACLLFSFSPVAVYFSVEGRMYSLLWCLVLALGWSTIRLAESGDRRFAGLWLLASVAGFLTHYFFAFVWLACVAWLGLVAGTSGRRRLAAFAGVTVLAVLPWYLQVPASLARWRVSGDWLNGDLAWPRAVAQPAVLAGSLLSGTTALGGWRWADRVAAGLLLLAACWMVRRRSPGPIFARHGWLLWAWLSAACAGPLAFDLLRHTMTSDIPRYVLPGLPAAILLAALASCQLPAKVQAAALGILVLAWLPGAWDIAHATVPRPRQPYLALDARLETWARPGDVVLVRSIPSGVVGVARYLDRDIPLAAWVGQLGTGEVPADLERLLRGRRRVAVATIHDLGAPNTLEPWLRTHARMLGRDTFPASRAEIVYFEPTSRWE